MTRRSHGPMLKNRMVGTGEEAPDQLLASPFNWRIHPEAQQDELEKLLETVGWVQRVIINKQTGHVVDGHLRVTLAMKRGEETIPVSYIDVSPAEEKLILASLDPLSAMAVRDDAKFDDLLQEVQVDFAPMEFDWEAIVPRVPKKAKKGLSHTINNCICCEKKCRKGCGCYRDDAEV